MPISADHAFCETVSFRCNAAHQGIGDEWLQKTDCRYRVLQAARSIADVDICNLTVGNAPSISVIAAPAMGQVLPLTNGRSQHMYLAPLLALVFANEFPLHATSGRLLAVIERPLSQGRLSSTKRSPTH